MSRGISHQTATGYNALTYIVGPNLAAAYSAADPDALVGRAVKLTGDKTVDLVGAGDKVLGALVKIAPNDGLNMKCTVQHAGQIRFVNPAAAANLTPNGRGVIGAANGGIALAAADTDPQFGVMTSIEADDVYIVIAR